MSLFHDYVVYVIMSLVWTRPNMNHHILMANNDLLCVHHRYKLIYGNDICLEKQRKQLFISRSS